MYAFALLSHSHVAVDCGALESPDNGVVTTTDTVYQSAAQYECNEGHRLLGSAMRTCQDNAEWSDVEPQCESKCSSMTCEYVMWGGKIIAFHLVQ